MKEIILKFFYILGLLTVCTPVFAEELYKCVTSQGTTYQSRPCSAKATQRNYIAEKPFTDRFVQQSPMK
ncbi:MAG: DUF4124 domain-containing protein [Acinetobacter sp.]|uniref:DUF4124 domain-containing protein n=1 Tax=Acinetobacter sp. TaxID=472 RepID=UPI000FB77D8D|nr:DUF4124 domain-containing protein [Acinetobacter sp.]RUP41829.1 MAG: DUF4124 domain-containing protein [Acinetobacter sp.]